KFPKISGEIEAIGVHHLGPGRHEILHERLFRVRTRIDFGEGAKLRVRAEDQVDTRAGPFQLMCLAVAALVKVVTGRHPFRAHVEQADEEVVRQQLGCSVKTPFLEPPAFAPSTRRPPTRTVISGPVSVRSCAGSTKASSGRMNCVLLASM